MPAQRLPWFKLWPEAVDHEKVAQLGDAQFRTWITVLAKAADQPTRWHFASRRHAAVVTGRAIGHINTLVSGRLLDDLGVDGVWIHDWKQWQDRYPSDYPEPSANAPPLLPEDPPERSANGHLIPPPSLHDDSVNAVSPLTLPSKEGRPEKREERVKTKDVDAAAVAASSPEPDLRTTPRANLSAGDLALHEQLIARERQRQPRRLGEILKTTGDDA